MSNINNIASHIHAQVAKIKRKPLLQRNDFIRAHQTHPIHWERESMADFFRDMWECVRIEVRVVKPVQPYCKLLIDSGRFNKIL